MWCKKHAMKDAEPEGLNMSLDALIQKRGGASTSRGGQGGRAAFRGRGRGRGNPRDLDVRGGVQKPETGIHQPSLRGGRGGRGPFAPSSGRGGGRTGMVAGRSGSTLGGHTELMLRAQLEAQNRLLHQTQMQMQMLAHQQQLLLQQQHMHPVPGARTFPQAALAPAQFKHHQQQALQTLEAKEQKDAVEGLACYLDEENANVVVTLQDTPLVTVTPHGDVLLSTNGWYTEDTGKHQLIYSQHVRISEKLQKPPVHAVTGMNQALKVFDMKIVTQGAVEEGNWKVQEGRSLTRYNEINGYMKMPARGTSTMNRSKVQKSNRAE